MTDKPNFFAVLPANIRYDKTLAMGARLLYAEITALSNQLGYCFASNSYFAELYEVDRRTVINWLNDLQQRGYISIEVNQSEGNTRQIYIGEIGLVSGQTVLEKVQFSEGGGSENNFTRVVKKNSLPSEKNFTHNNTINNTINNNSLSARGANQKNENSEKIQSLENLAQCKNSLSKKLAQKKVFTAPSIEEVIAYCEGKIPKDSKTPYRFFSKFEGVNWHHKGDKITNWQLILDTWIAQERKEKPKQTKQATNGVNQFRILPNQQYDEYF